VGAVQPVVYHFAFAKDMSYRSASSGWRPGGSIFRHEADCVVRVADTGFRPNDDFCAL
jgi:hypothetical protein